MSTHHTIVFPRYTEDVTSGRRTLMHWPRDEFTVDDTMTLVGHQNAVRGIATIITDVRKVSLQALTEDDLVKLGGISREDYFARWDAAHPEHPVKSDPEVFRIEFRYGVPADVWVRSGEMEFALAY